MKKGIKNFKMMSVGVGYVKAGYRKGLLGFLLVGINVIEGQRLF